MAQLAGVFGSLIASDTFVGYIFTIAATAYGADTFAIKANTLLSPDLGMRSVHSKSEVFYFLFVDYKYCVY